MKKKFDFTAEMKETQATISTPQNEYLKEEKRLLGINVKELAELNDSKHSDKYIFYTLRFDCSFAAANTIKPQLL